MPITQAQRIERRGHIGASDVAGIFGLDPYITAYNIWAEKTCKVDLEPQDEDPNDVKNIGTLFEPVVMRWAEGILGLIEPDVELRYSDPQVPLVAHLDGQVVEDGHVVEAKTAGMRGPIHEHWGEDYTDDIPHRIIVQVSAQMMCAKTEFAHVPAFLGGRGFVMYQVGVEDPDIFQMISDKLGHFWNYNVLKDIPPDDSAPTMDVIKRIIRTPREVVAVDPDLFEKAMTLRQARLDAKKAADEAMAELLGALGTAEGGECDLGMITYMEQHRKAYSVKANTSRVARFKKAK